MNQSVNYDFDALSRQLKDRFAADKGSVPDVSFVRQQVECFLSQARSLGDLETISRKIVEHVGVDRLLPECYARFQPLVTESMVFLLQQLPEKRLARKIVDQLLLTPDVLHGQRLLVLINDMPTLQKLGQIICRKPGLAPEFKKALIDLEDNVNTVRYADLLVTIEQVTKAANRRFVFQIENEILAEATVCAVVAAQLYDKRKKKVLQSVLKVIKPDVRQNLSSELALFRRLADFLDHNRYRWGLGDFQFKDTLDQVQWLLENEINLAIEQANLKTAGRYYPKRTRLVIPNVMPCSTPSITVMSRVDGRKITDVEGLDARQRHRLAATLAETCILRPLKDFGDVTIFHGDPHAGNIAYTMDKSKPRIIFYDWGMMGRLDRFERFALAVMAIGVLARSPKIVMFAAEIISQKRIVIDEDASAALQATVHKILKTRSRWTGNIISDINRLVGEFTYYGLKFPTNLLMFQKAMITLEGVLADIDPTFDDDQLIWVALGSQMRNLGQPRYYWGFYKECLTLGIYSTTKLLKLHWLITKLAIEMGLTTLGTPLRPSRSESVKN
jgi:ubiquinone biosynthesis protein